MNHVKTYPGENVSWAQTHTPAVKSNSCFTHWLKHLLYDSELQLCGLTIFFICDLVTNLNSTSCKKDTTCCHKQELYVLYVVSKPSLVLALILQSRRSVNFRQWPCFQIHHYLLVISTISFKWHYQLFFRLLSGKKSSVPMGVGGVGGGLHLVSFYHLLQSQAAGPEQQLHDSQISQIKH